MAYQNVGTPRFYVNVIEWLTSNDVNVLNPIEGTLWNSSVWNTLPVNPATYYTNYYNEETNAVHPPDLVNIPTGVFNDKSFWAILGHDFPDNTTEGFSHFLLDQNDGSLNGVDIINFTPPPEYKGFSIATYNLTDIQSLKVMASHNVGSMVLGTYYDMPNAPNLSLTMSREYGGTKEFTTYNGSSMSNTMWSKPPKWGDLGAWELGSGNPSLAKSGRRTWQLKFGFMDDGDLFGSNQALSIPYSPFWAGGEMLYYEPIYTSTGYDDVDWGIGFFVDNLLTDDNFFSQVWHKTLGGTLPFIFQPDGSNNNPDQFCIAKFKDSSLKATQSAFNVYDISLSIEEVW